MIKETFVALGRSARGLLRGWGGLALLHLLYAALLATAYWFFATGVATVTQNVVSAITALLAPLVFLLLQAAAAHFALGETRPGALAARALRDCWKMLVVALPLVALGVGLFYLLGWGQEQLPAADEAARAAGATESAARAAATPGGPSGGVVLRPLHWRDTLVSTLWILLLGFVLPLAAAHLWLSVARDGLKATLRRFHRVVGRAFLPRSVLAYAVGLFFFGFMPYFVLFTRTPLGAAWAELALFGLRLALVFVFTLWGWAATLGALAALAPPPAAAPETPADVAPETPDAPADARPQMQT